MPSLKRFAAGTTLAVVLLAALLAGGAVQAHALPQSSEPRAGSDLASAPAAVSITFGETPDAKLSSIRVLDTSGASVTAGPAIADASDPARLSVPLEPLGPGVYTVAWRTLSAVDGHLASGSFAFGVGAAPPVATTTGSAAGGSDNAGPAPLAILGRWLLYLGLIGLAGAAIFGGLVAPGQRLITRRLLPACWLLAAAGTALVVAVQVSEAGIGLGDVAGTSLAGALLARTVPLVLAGLGLLLAARRPCRRWPLLLVGGLASLALLADVAYSHAAAGSGGSVDVLVQALHVLAVAMWLGGLAGLLLTVRGAPNEATAFAARRFSWIATIGIATVALTGLLRAIAEVGSIAALLDTDYGRLVLLKTALLAVIAILGLVNHFRHVPVAGQELRSLRQLGSLELLVGATIVLLSASLVNLVPPVEVVATSTPVPGSSASPDLASAPIVAQGQDFGTSVRLSLEASPGTAGFNAFTATVVDPDTGAPLTADKVTLRFAIPGRPGIDGSRLDLLPSSPGTFAGSGPNLSLDGTWDVTALVVQGLASVEVPLKLTPRPPPQQVDVSAQAGLPTINSVHLPGGLTMQSYLDPGTAGPNEVHATFFDAAGTELPVKQASMVLTPDGGAQQVLTERMLEPGHFVADVPLAAGPYSLIVTGTAPDGTLLSAGLDVSVALLAGSPSPAPSGR